MIVIMLGVLLVGLVVKGLKNWFLRKLVRGFIVW